jgi:hypothetical protein
MEWLLIAFAALWWDKILGLLLLLLILGWIVSHLTEFFLICCLAIAVWLVSTWHEMQQKRTR